MRLKFCAICGEMEGLEFHHFQPRAFGGSDEESNILTLCSNCHGKAHNMRRADIGAMTRAALAWRKAMGLPLGSPNPQKGGKASAKLRQAAAIARDRTWLAVAGAGSLSERAARLNAAGYRTTEGKLFTPATLSRMVRRSSQKS